jgi:hypothetical protein
MAFNPFAVFRRNQKTLFAILTVFIMIMFTLSFGAGDFFDWFPRWLGSKRGTGEIMAVVDGSNIYESDLYRRQTGRTLANQFMSQANAIAANNAVQSLRTGVGQASATTKEAANMVVQLHDLLTSERGLDQRMLQFILQSYQEAEGRLSAILADTNQTKDDQEVARAAQNLITLDLQRLFAAQQGYFTNQPNRSNKDVLEFKLWLRKAEQLGINYTPADARELIAREFFGYFTDADYRELEAQFQRSKQAFTKERLEQALADEFRVRAAQTVVLGPVTSRTTANPGVHAFSTPYDDYQYFRDQYVSATYGVIAVPVANFVPKVTENPTEAELREIFQKYRNREPNPMSEEPGLKEPRKLKMQWIEVRGDEPFYTNAAESTLQRAETQAKLAGFLTAPVGPAVMGLLTAPAPLLIEDPALNRAYEEYKQRFQIEADTSLFPSIFGSHRLIGPEIVRPANLVAATGAVAGSLITGASPFTPGLVFEQRAATEARNDRVGIHATLFANPLIPGAGVDVVLGSAAASLARMPQPLPLSVVRYDLLKKTKDDLARRLATEDLERFQAELTKLGQKKDRSEAQAYVEKFVQERGLKLGGSTEFHDQYTIDQDPGLAPLREKMERGHMAMLADAPLQFGREFFFEVDPRQQREVPATTFYAPQPYPQTGMLFPGFQMPISIREGEPTYLVWRTEEIPAAAPRTFEAAREKALEAWKKIKARELAKQAAEELAKEANAFSEQAGTLDGELRDLHSRFVERFTDPAARERAKYFLISNVSPIRSVGSPFMPGRGQYEEFRLRPTKDLPYPTPEMEQELLKNKDKPLSTALVLPDAGKNTYYVAVLKHRREDIDVDTFFTKVYASPGQDELGQILNFRHRQEELQQARNEAVALLRAEFNVTKEHPKLSEKVDTSYDY